MLLWFMFSDNDAFVAESHLRIISPSSVSWYSSILVACDIFSFVSSDSTLPKQFLLPVIALDKLSLCFLENSLPLSFLLIFCRAFWLCFLPVDDSDIFFFVSSECFLPKLYLLPLFTSLKIFAIFL